LPEGFDHFSHDFTAHGGVAPLLADSSLLIDLIHLFAQLFLADRIPIPTEEQAEASRGALSY